MSRGLSRDRLPASFGRHQSFTFLFAAIALQAGIVSSASAQTPPKHSTPGQQIIAANLLPSLPPPPPLSGIPSAPPPAISASLNGTVTDLLGDAVAEARITLEGASSADARTEVTGPAGHFEFPALTSGPVRLTVDAPGLESFIWTGSVRVGEAVVLPPIALRLASTDTSMDVQASTSEVAAAQVSLEEKQRVLGFYPNFYAVYVSDAAPLSSRQKFSMAWKSSIDPVTLAATGFMAGIQQAKNDWSGYGQGSQGYAKRYGAGYADLFIGNMLGGAILPSLFHQDPRYFVKASGSVPSRAFYAVATTVICRNDRGRWRPNYSNVIGTVASASISNLYYPRSSRQGASLTIENSLIETAEGAFGSLMQEFVIRRMTPHVPDYESSRR